MPLGYAKDNNLTIIGKRGAIVLKLCNVAIRKAKV